MRKMKLAMLIVFCVMLFGGTVVSFVLPDREFSDVENRELAKKPKITAKRILSGEYQKEYDTYLSDQFFLRDKWVDLAVDVYKRQGYVLSYYPSDKSSGEKSYPME